MKPDWLTEDEGKYWPLKTMTRNDIENYGNQRGSDFEFRVLAVICSKLS